MTAFTKKISIVVKVPHSYSQHQTLKQIQESLDQQYQLPISLKEVQLLSEAFLALVTTVAHNDPELTA